MGLVKELRRVGKFSAVGGVAFLVDIGLFNLLRLDPVTGGVSPPTAYHLLVAAPGLPWHERGTLRITWSTHDCTRRHDPVGEPLAGTWTHPLWARLRDPSYAASQDVPAT